MDGMADADASGGTAGDRLRIAREAAGLSLDDVAARTRIPNRHLVAIETAAWDRLPGPTYVAGFAKSYADVVGLDRKVIGDDIRVEMGGSRSPVHAEAFQPADPARIPPRTLAIGAAVLAAVAAGGWVLLREDELGEAQPQFIAPADVAPPRPQAAAATPARPTAAGQIGGPVVLTAREPVWVKVEDRGGAVFASRELKAGERIEVPSTAQDPILRTGRAELLDVTVGGRPAPVLGPANQLIRDRSLRPEAVLASSAMDTPGPGSATARP